MVQSVWLSLFSWLLFLPSGETQIPAEDNYREGLQFLENGDIDAALDVWLLEWNKYATEPGYQVDVRSAFAYIDVATGYEKESAYKVASQFYFAALKSSKMDAAFDELEAELKLVSVMLPKSKRRWIKKLEEPLPSNFSKKITDIWTSLDSNPMTVENESLIDFYIRKNLADFMFPDVGFEDERKQTILRFGFPEKRTGGTYVPNLANISTVISNRLSQGMNSQGADFAIYVNYVRNHLIGFSFVYETWTYADKEYVFVSTSGGEYKEMQPKDVIPSALQRRPNLRSIEWEVPDIVPAFFVIHDISSFMSTKSESYATQFSNMQTSSEQIATGNAVTSTLRNETDLVVNKSSSDFVLDKFTRPETNIAEKNNSNIDIDYEHYLFYRPDQDSIIHFVTAFAEFDSSKNFNTFTVDLNQEDISIPDLELARFSIGADNQDPRSSLEMSKYPGEKPWFKSMYSTAEAQVTGVDTIKKREVLKVNAFIPMLLSKAGDTSRVFLGSGSTFIDYAVPSFERANLAISDIVIGYVEQKGYGSDERLFSFQITKGKQIPKSKNLSLYFEVYNLDQLGSGEQDFEVKLRVRDAKNLRVFDRIGKRGTTLRLNSMNSWEPLELEYETQRLDMGEYELLVEVIHTNSQKSIRKTIPFRIVEP